MNIDKNDDEQHHYLASFSFAACLIKAAFYTLDKAINDNFEVSFTKTKLLHPLYTYLSVS